MSCNSNEMKSICEKFEDMELFVQLPDGRIVEIVGVSGEFRNKNSLVIQTNIGNYEPVEVTKWLNE